MLRLREDQMSAFSLDAVKDFENRMLGHLGVLFPAYLERLGQDEALALVRQGIERAAAYGIVSERGVCIFIDAMFAFGRGFDRDPSLPWVAEILGDPRASSGDEKAHRLFEAGFEHLDEARGVFA